jgi:hypothetical protein
VRRRCVGGTSESRVADRVRRRGHVNVGGSANLERRRAAEGDAADLLGGVAARGIHVSVLGFGGEWTRRGGLPPSHPELKKRPLLKEKKWPWRRPSPSKQARVPYPATPLRPNRRPAAGAQRRPLVSLPPAPLAFRRGHISSQHAGPSTTGTASLESRPRHRSTTRQTSRLQARTDGLDSPS